MKSACSWRLTLIRIGGCRFVGELLATPARAATVELGESRMLAAGAVTSSVPFGGRIGSGALRPAGWMTVPGRLVLGGCPGSRAARGAGFAASSQSLRV